ncbi:putative toxin-antitoxin system toxin component, PIN family [Halochromatium roseum]|uniref:putative toxin-antitoxin system toxin component, PIN family n=1 Tax=Halochromatium roseum TaxID=391920 RepID=UPI001913460B|nr:putative toxin-antitoxin system toxin component, PIN family [Halochromatium roseum]
MRYLIDTCVVLSALRSRRGASNALLRQAFEANLPVVVHFKLVAEYREVLLREEHLRATGLDAAAVDRFLAAYVGIADEISVHYLWRPNLPDENDNFVLEIAIAASPCTIVTHNIRDFRQGERRFAGVHVARPAEILTLRYR